MNRFFEKNFYIKTAQFTVINVKRILILLLLVAFVLPAFPLKAAVLFDNSKIGTAYDLTADAGAGRGYYTVFPQYSGMGPLFSGGGIAYSGTAAWLRVKRISGVGCDAVSNVLIADTDGNSIGSIYSGAMTVGEFCDFPIIGPNVTDKALGFVALCLNNGCVSPPGALVLDGSPENAGFMLEGSQTLPPIPGGWAFQICDAEGCSGGFESSEPELEGASSVLFLPGIQASRLYKAGLFGEDQIWPPNELFNADILDLSMNADGVSNEEIYTKDIIDTSLGVGDVYANFQTFLDQLEEDDVIDGWSSFAYDWRYSVTDVAQNGTQYEDELKDAIEEIERLVNSSFSGQVTIIGHSNGGLLAKALMLRLEAEGKTTLVDKVVLLASPQLGTPKAIGTILHGYDQTDSLGGIVMDGNVVRKVTNNLPGAYGLLPSDKYFDGLNEPLITFADSNSTGPYVTTYGQTIAHHEGAVSFYKGENDGFDRDLEEKISTPVRVNSAMMNDAVQLHNVLDNWTAPEGIEVIEIVGTGLPTMKAINYREVEEDRCASSGPAGIVCVTESFIKPYAILTQYGDGTVVQRSAEGYEGGKQNYFVDLKALEDAGLDSEYAHHNITEALPVQNLLSDIILGTTTENSEFISTSHTEFNDQYDVEIIDSPVRLLSTDSSGNQTGVVNENGTRIIRQDIPGSQYFEFGDTKYLVVPKGTDRTTKLFGEDYGGYTLTIAKLDAGDTQTIQSELKNATTTPTLVAEYSNEDGEFGTVVVDEDGDGEKDYEMTLDGQLVEEEVVVTYPLLISTIESLNLSKTRKQALLLIVKSAEYYAMKTPTKSLYLKLEDGLLHSAQELINVYTKKRYLAYSDAAILLEMIKSLEDKQ